MLRFDQLVRGGSIIRDVKQRFPEAAVVFESFGFRESCDDCSIEQVARKYGLDSREIVDAVNRAISTW